MPSSATVRAVLRAWRIMQRSTLTGLQSSSACEVGAMPTLPANGALGGEKPRRARHSFPPITLGPPGRAVCDVIACSLWGVPTTVSPRRAVTMQSARAMSIPALRCRFIVNSSGPRRLLVSALEGARPQVQHDDQDADPAPPPRSSTSWSPTTPVSDAPHSRRRQPRKRARSRGGRGMDVADGRPFHAMRDWWTPTTDPILAGLWRPGSGRRPAAARTVAGRISARTSRDRQHRSVVLARLHLALDQKRQHSSRSLLQDPGSRTFPAPAPPATIISARTSIMRRSSSKQTELARFRPKRRLPSRLAVGLRSRSCRLVSRAA